MGIPTGAEVPAAARASMPYGEQMSNVGTIGRQRGAAIANGVTFGMADKFAGGMDALTGNAPSYDAGVKAERARTEAIRPEQRVAGEVRADRPAASGLERDWSGAALPWRAGLARHCFGGSLATVRKARPMARLTAPAILQR